MYCNVIEVTSLNHILWVTLFAETFLSFLLQEKGMNYYLMFSGLEWLWEILSSVEKLKSNPPNRALLIVPREFRVNWNAHVTFRWNVFRGVVAISAEEPSCWLCVRGQLAKMYHTPPPAKKYAHAPTRGDNNGWKP